MVADHQGNLWFGVQDYPRLKAATEMDASRIEKTVGMYPGAVTRFDGERWTVFTHNEGLAADWVSAIDVTPCGNVWFATQGGSGYGVSKFDGERMTTYTMADGLAGNQVRTLHAGSSGKIFFGTSTGLSVYIPQEQPAAVNNTEPSPLDIRFLVNHPNPFNPSTTISFTMPAPGRVNLAVYSVTGQKVRELISEGAYRSNGTYRMVWDGKDDHGNAVSSGIYITQLRAGGRIASMRMALVK